MSDRKIDVRVFDPELLRREIQAQVRLRPRVRRSLPDLPARNLLGSWLCAALIVALHTAVLAPLLAGGGAHNRQHPQPSSGFAQGAEPDGALQVSIISAGAPDRSAAAPDLGEAALQQVSVDLKSLAVPADVPESDGAGGAGASADSAGDSVLAGRYAGQIDARIERAWLRPRTPIGAIRFSCRVSIEQDASGNVKEVALERCNGDARWQLSLVHAIQRASPLPAPPDPAVFRRTLRLTFNAEAFRPGSSAEGYEPELSLSAMQHAGDSAAAEDAVGIRPEPDQ